MSPPRAPQRANPHAPTLATLLQVPQRLEITCHRCNRGTVVMSAEDAVAKFGADMTFVRLKRILRCDLCGEHGRDRMIDARGSVADYYDAVEREKYAKEVAELGQDQADLTRSYRLRGQGRS